MNGPEHYLAAEELLEIADDFPVGSDALEQAKVHAILAQTAAIIDAGNTIGYEGGGQISHEVYNSRGWKRAIK